MIKTEFEYNGTNVVAYAQSVDARGLSGMVIKFVDSEGDRIYPRLSDGDREQIEELAMENLQNEDGLEELKF